MLKHKSLKTNDIFVVEIGSNDGIMLKNFLNKKIKHLGIEPSSNVAKIAKKNLKIYEVSVNYYGRKYSEGKKITWRDGFSAIRCIIKYNILR